ncbi:MAG TPA: hypothetical protein VJ914_03280 [Pseudonocardiaceae bacterium]|nr:hypothetical protein [Pseudonocardiaceae bacterium]
MAIYQGRVSGFMPRSESSVYRKRMTLVWDFRVERMDAVGRPLPRIAAEMRGKYFRGGSLSNGDVVELAGQQNRSGLVTVSRVKNLTAGTVIHAHNYNASVVILYLFLLLTFAGVAATIMAALPAGLMK